MAGKTDISEMTLEQKKALLKKLMEKKKKKDFSYPLSSGQKGLWFIQKMEPRNYAYNVPAAFRIQGGLEKRILKKSFEILIERHPILQTVVQIDDHGDPLQSFASGNPLFFREESITDLDESEIEPLLRTRVRKPFDLEKGPLMRVYLFSGRKSEHILLVVFHHIIFDGSSLLIFMDELQKIYESESTGKKAPPPAIESSYADFVKWQENMLRSEEGKKHKDYWLRTLAGETPILNLPTLRGAGARAGECEIHRTEMTRESTEKIKQLAHGRGVYPFTVLLSAYNVLLYRYTQQEDIITGTPAAGRTSAEFEDLIGYFINMLPIRTHLSGDMSFGNVLNQIHESSMEALEHQDYPFPEMVAALKTGRDLSRNPLFQTTFTFQNWARGPERAFLEKGENEASLRLEHMPTIHQENDFDLTLEIFDAEHFLLFFKYDSGLFHRDSIVRMADHFKMLLECLVHDPGRNISESPFLTEVERNKILVEFNDTKTDYPHDKCIHHLFEERAERTPDAPAVVFEDKRLTYKELNERANRLGRYLQKLGVGPEVMVGICMERSIEMIVGIPGILKAGGAYIPLDPTYPGQRLAFMLEDAKAPVLLTRKALTDSLPAHGANVVRLDSDWESIAGERKIMWGVAWCPRIRHMRFLHPAS